MSDHRPVLISTMQFEAELKNGALTVFDVIETARRLGVDGVELRRELWPGWRDEAEAARRWAGDRGLLLTYATFATLFSPDAVEAAQLYEDIETAAALGSPIFRVFQGPMPADDDEAGWEAAQAVVEYAGDYNVILALENYARTPGGTLAEVRHVLDRITDRALATNLDIGNYARHGEDVPTAIRTLGSRIASAHLKDQPHNLDELPTFLGGGDQELAPIFAAFDELPQRILYCFEFRDGDIIEGIRNSIAYLRKRS